MSRPVISVENLSKAYRIGLKEEIPETIFQAATGWVKSPLRNWRELRRLNTYTAGRQNGNGNGAATAALADEEDLIWALRDVSFEVAEGEVLGVIGRNGAGKSTLLKILSRITEPTCGRVVIRGRVSSLLEVGTGFHPELTGRENIYMNGTILGMRKREIDRKFDQIVAFSGIEKFLDTPVKRYSSGMTVRLAFSVAAHLEPEILIVDEVLAVGDVEFQKRCLGKMNEVARGGRTVLFVSHNMAAVGHLCSRCLVLRDGSVCFQGSVRESLEWYMSSSRPVDGATSLIERPRADGLTPTISGVTLYDESGLPTDTVQCMGELTIEIEYTSSKPLVLPRFGIVFEDQLSGPLFFVQSDIQTGQLPRLPARGRVRCHIPQVPLVPGRYYLTLGCSNHRIQLDKLERAAQIDVIEADVFGTGNLPPASHGKYIVPARWSLADVNAENELGTRHV